MEKLRKLFENKGTFIPDSPEEEEPKFYTEKEPMDIDVSGGFSDEDEETNEITINGKKYRPINEDWWSDMSPEQQAAYIKKHPNSKQAQDKKKDDEEGGFGIPDQDLKDTVLQDLNPTRDSERDERGLPTNKEEWNKEKDEVESLHSKAEERFRRAKEDSEKGDDDPEEQEYLDDRAREAEEEYKKYNAVRNAYQEKGKELGVTESVHPLKEQYDRFFTNRIVI